LKLTDLGLAKALGEGGGPVLTAGNTSLGTPAYMAPEQHVSAHDIDQRCDVFALGVMLYYLLTGRPPFSGEDSQRLFESKCVGLQRGPAALLPELPAVLDQLVLDMLAPERDARLGDYSVILGELEAALSEREPGALHFGGRSVAPQPPRESAPTLRSGPLGGNLKVMGPEKKPAKKRRFWR